MKIPEDRFRPPQTCTHIFICVQGGMHKHTYAATKKKYILIICICCLRLLDNKTCYDLASALIFLSSFTFNILFFENVLHKWVYIYIYNF